MSERKMSWRRMVKQDPEFFSKYKLNTNVAHGPVYIPIGTKVVSPNKNNPYRGKTPKPKMMQNPIIKKDIDPNQEVYTLYSDNHITITSTEEPSEAKLAAYKMYYKYDLPADDWFYYSYVLEALEKAYELGQNSVK